MASVVGGGKFEVIGSKNINSDFHQYRATRLWNEIINHLRENAAIGRKRHLIWLHENVFSGANAVEVIINFLEINKDKFPNVVTRDMAIKVCQTLMDKYEFIPVLKGQSSSKFDPGHGALYRFVSCHSDVAEKIAKTRSKENILLSPTKRVSNNQKSARNSRSPGPYPNPFSLQKHKCKERRSLDPSAFNRIEARSPLLTSNNLACHNPNGSSFSRANGLRRRHSFVTGLDSESKPNSSPQTKNPKLIDAALSNRNRSLRMSLHKLKLKSVRHEPNYEQLLTNDRTTDTLPSNSSSYSRVPTRESVHDLAMSYLLTLIDIPFLESVLSQHRLDTEAVRPSTTHDNPTLNPAVENVVSSYSNRFGQNKISDITRIPWVSAAVTCIGFIPDGLGSLWSAQACKLKCYRAVVTYHLGFLSSILPENLLPVYLCIIEDLKKGRANNALKVLTLVVILLPLKRRMQLENLIRFLKIVSEDLFVNVDKRMTNRDCVVRDFSSVVLCHPVVGVEQNGAFLDFLLSRAVSVFNSVHWALARSSTDELCSLWKTNFCQRAKLSESEQKLWTARHLVLLATSVRDHTKITSKEKKQFIKKFEKLYPELCV